MNILKIEVILLLSLVIGLWSLPGGCVEYMPLGRENSVQRINEEVEDDQEVELPFEDIPYDDDEMTYRAAEYLALGEYMNAIEVCERALNSYPEDPWLICSIGDIYSEYLDDAQKATEYYELANQYDPYNPHSIIAKSKVFFLRQDNEKGCDVLKGFINECDFRNDKERYLGYHSIWMLTNIAYGNDMYDELEGAVSLVLRLPGYDRWEESLIQMYVIQTMVLYEFLHENDIQVEKYLGVYKEIIDCHEDADRVRSALELQYSARLYDFCEEMMKLYFTE